VKCEDVGLVVGERTASGGRPIGTIGGAVIRIIQRVAWVGACVWLIFGSLYVSSTTKAASVSAGPISLVRPVPGFGPAHPVGCNPASTSAMTLTGTSPFEPLGGSVVNANNAKVSGLAGVNFGQLTLVGDIALGSQTPTGSLAVPAFAGPITAASGSFGLSSGSVSVSGAFVGLSQPPLGAASGLNAGSCYGWDSGDSDPATSAAQVRVDLRVPYVGQRTDSGGTSSISGIVVITTSWGCSRATISTSVCGTGTSLTFEEAAAPACVPVPSGAIGWWRGEVDFAAAVGPDLTGLSAFSPGMAGSGFALGRIELLAAPALPAVSTGLSLEAWVSPVMDEGVSQTIMSRWDFPSTDDSARSYWLRIDAGGQIVFETDETSTRRPEVLVAFAPGLLIGGPYHVAATWSPTSINIYVDGILHASKPSQGGQLNAASTTAFRIGSQTRGFGYAGLIDEPTVYDRALTATEIAAIAAAGTAGKCSA